MNPYDKSFSSISDQIAVLKERGMVFGDEEKAKKCLERVSYYRLSAYWYPFRIVQSNGVIADDFKPETSFEEVFEFYVFDKSVRIIISDALERIEIALRAQISSQLGKLDRFAHRDAQYLDGNFRTKRSDRNHRLTKHEDWLESQDNKFKNSREDFAKSFRKKYSGHPPIWISKEVWDWGMLSHLYAGLKYSDRNEIAEKYGNISGQDMILWVRSLNDVRNICAHHSRLWNRALRVTLPDIESSALPCLDHINGNEYSLSRLYGALNIMIVMMKSIHSNTEWHRRVMQLALIAPSNTLIGLRAAGFPENWEKK